SIHLAVPMVKARQTQRRETRAAGETTVAKETLIRKPSFRSSLPLLALVFLTSLLIRLPLLPIPFERDEGDYAYIAWRMGYNEVPYHDWVDQKPPGVFVVYRLAMMLPMDSVSAIHLTGALFAAAGAVGVLLLARRFMSDFWAGFTGSLFGVMT